MKVGQLIKLHDSARRNGPYAGKFGIIVEFDPYDNPVVNVGGKIIDFHYTQIEEVISENR